MGQLRKLRSLQVASIMTILLIGCHSSSNNIIQFAQAQGGGGGGGADGLGDLGLGNLGLGGDLSNLGGSSGGSGE